MYYLKLALEYFLLFGIFRITISQSTTNCESVNSSPDCSGVLSYALVPSENECQRTFLPLLRDLQSKLEMVVMHGDQLSYKILSKVSDTNQNTRNLTNLKELTSTLFQLQNALEGQGDYSEYFQNISKANADTRNNLSSVLQEIAAQVKQLTKTNTGISVANITNIQNAITTLGSQIDDTLSQLNDKTSMLKNMTEVCNLHETVSAIIQSAMEELKQEINKSAASQCNALSKTHTTITAKSSTQHSSTTSTTPGQPIQDQTTKEQTAKEQTAKEPTTQGPTTMKQTTHEPTTMEQVTQFQTSAVPIPDNKMNSTEFAELRQLLSQLTSIAIAQEQKIDNLTTSLDEVKNVVTQQENIIKCLDKGCPPGFVKWRCSCYVAVNKSYNWYQARDNCGQMNGHLADISSYEEHNFLRTVIDSMWQTIGVYVPGYNSAFWLGGTEYELPPTTATSSTSASPSSATTETSTTSGVTTSSGSITPNENEMTTVSSTSSETTTSAMKDTDAMTHSMDSTSDSEITTVPSGTRSSMAPLSTPTTTASADVNTHSMHSTKGDSVITTVPPSTSGDTTSPKTSSTTIAPNQSGATTSPELTTSTVNQPTFTLIMDQTTTTLDTTLSGRKKRQASQDSKPVGWVWYHTDQPFTFTFWNPGEPNDWNNDEDCMAMAAYNADYRWNDYNCQSEYIASVCEIDLDQF